MSTFKIIITAIVCLFVLSLENTMALDNISILKSKLKRCNNNDENCKRELQQMSDTIFKNVGKNFNNNFMHISNDISINHCHSIIKEIFYHMSKLKPYHNYKNVFLLKKLKKLKQYRDKLDQQKIDSNDFNRMITRTEKQYLNDLRESQDYIDEKVSRMAELCQNLKDNLDAIYNSPDQKDKNIPGYLISRITDLQNDPIWQDFDRKPSESKKIRDAILYASKKSGTKLIPKLESIFSIFASSTGGVVFSPELVNRLIKKYAVQ